MTQTREPNADAIVQTFAYIEQHPEEHNQRWFVMRSVCGTTYCFAGHALVNVAREPWHQPNAMDRAAQVLGLTQAGYDDCDGEISHQNGEHTDPYCADRLFYNFGTLDDLYFTAADILGIDETVLREKVAAEIANGQVQQ